MLRVGTYVGYDERDSQPLLFDGETDHVAGACHFCAGAFGVREQLEQQQFPLLRDQGPSQPPWSRRRRI